MTKLYAMLLLALMVSGTTSGARKVACPLGTVKGVDGTSKDVDYNYNKLASDKEADC